MYPRRHTTLFWEINQSELIILQTEFFEFKRFRKNLRMVSGNNNYWPNYLAASLYLHNYYANIYLIYLFISILPLKMLILLYSVSRLNYIKILWFYIYIFIYVSILYLYMFSTLVSVVSSYYNYNKLIK